VGGEVAWVDLFRPQFHHGVCTVQGGVWRSSKYLKGEEDTAWYLVGIRKVRYLIGSVYDRFVNG
jgi:hypothetical protein